jgi:hypothetical protein
MDQLDVGARLASRERHPQRVKDEIGAHVGRELPADDAAAVDVDHEREEDQALPAAQVGEVRDPQRIRPVGGELALHEIGPTDRSGVGDRGAPGLAAPLGALDAGRAHQPLDAVATDLDAFPAQRLPRPPVPVGVVVGRVQALDALQQPLVADDASGSRTGGALVVRGRRHVQGPADRLDAEAAAVLVDEAAHFGRSASSSVAKNTDAALRISFARLSS